MIYMFVDFFSQTYLSIRDLCSNVVFDYVQQVGEDH